MLGMNKVAQTSRILSDGMKFGRKLALEYESLY